MYQELYAQRVNQFRLFSKNSSPVLIVYMTHESKKYFHKFHYFSWCWQSQKDKFRAKFGLTIIINHETNVKVTYFFHEVKTIIEDRGKKLVRGQKHFVLFCNIYHCLSVFQNRFLYLCTENVAAISKHVSKCQGIHTQVFFVLKFKWEYFPFTRRYFKIRIFKND